MDSSTLPMAFEYSETLYRLRDKHQAVKPALSITEINGVRRIGRTPDCLASQACIPGSNPADPVWGFQRNILVSPFSM